MHYQPRRFTASLLAPLFRFNFGRQLPKIMQAVEETAEPGSYREVMPATVEAELDSWRGLGMSTDGSRRFTDREVAIVLRKASELEESVGAGGGTGLSMRELEQIAVEVGISPTLLRKAVDDMDARGGRSLLAGGPLAHQSIRGIQGELDQEGIARLVEIVEGTSDHVGVVTEALGGTQWTASDRFRTTQVSITPSKGETRVRVVERATARLRVVAHAVPAWFGFAAVAGTVGALDLSSQLIAGAMGIGVAAGAVVGRGIWSHLSAKSAARVERLAAALSREAEDAASPATGDAEDS